METVNPKHPADTLVQTASTFNSVVPCQKKKITKKTPHFAMRKTRRAMPTIAGMREKKLMVVPADYLLSLKTFPKRKPAVAPFFFLIKASLKIAATMPASVLVWSSQMSIDLRGRQRGGCVAFQVLASQGTVDLYWTLYE